jgi:hypothetical protein
MTTFFSEAEATVTIQVTGSRTALKALEEIDTFLGGDVEPVGKPMLGLTVKYISIDTDSTKLRRGPRNNAF